MTIVGFDTSLPVTTACVLRADGRVFATPPPSPERLLGRPEHSAELLPLVAGLLEEAEVDWPQVRALAVGVGPERSPGFESASRRRADSPTRSESASARSPRSPRSPRALPGTRPPGSVRCCR